MKLSLSKILKEVYVSTGKDFDEFYTGEKVNQIRNRADSFETAKQDVLMFLHNFNRNKGRHPKAGDVTARLGDYAMNILYKLQDEDLIRMDEYGSIFPGKQAASHGSYVMMDIGAQGGA